MYHYSLHRFFASYARACLIATCRRKALQTVAVKSRGIARPFANGLRRGEMPWYTVWCGSSLQVRVRFT